MTPSPDTCTKVDAVLAIHLDGDLVGGGSAHDDRDGSGFDFVCSETLTAHLRECAVCQRQLKRARRLDAALAADAGRALAEHAHQGGSNLDQLAPRWFAVATDTAVACDPTPPAAPTARVPQLVARDFTVHAATACLLAAAVAVFVLLRGAHDGIEPTAQRRTECEARDVGVGEVGVGEVGAGEVTADGTTPDGAAPDGARSDGAGRIDSTAHAQGTSRAAHTLSAPDALPTAIAVAGAPNTLLRRQRERLAAPGQELTRSLAEQQIVWLDANGAPLERRAAARALLAAARPTAPDARHALRTLVDTLAACGDRSAADRLLHGDMLDLVRSSSHVLAYLEVHLVRLDPANRAMRREDFAALTVAARLGTPELDLAIRRLLRRAPELAPDLAAALRCGQRSEGSAALLLDAWQDLVAMGACTDEQAAAWLWFGGQPTRVFEELEGELRACRSTPRRLRCILALGCCADARTLPILLERLQCRHIGEAHTAAFALSSLPRASLRTLLAQATADEQQYLLRAALARAALPETRAWTLAMALSPAQLRLLDGASFEQFPIVVGWFRERLTALGD